ncbi:MAG TPA: alkaline phosphatase family protein [Candidatus Aminicenantes bacterium]|nr:alkaline phosphatase family protein [Candidatus Aminicenantes bacterium]
MKHKRTIAWFAAGILAAAGLVIVASRFLTRTGRAHGPRVYVIGLDGATWDILDPLIARGELPVFKRLKQESAWARLRTFEPTLSAVVWTSIATGKSMLKHGIVDWLYVNKQKLQVPYSSSEKRVPSIWEMMDEKKRKSVVLSWFVTDPPDAIDGVMVSDSFPSSLHRFFSGRRQNRDFANTVYPPEEFKGLMDYFSRVQRSGALEYSRLIGEMGIPDYPRLYRERFSKEPGKIPILGVWNAFMVYNRVVDLMAERYMEKGGYDLFLAYYRLPDIFFHFGTLFLDPEYNERINRVIDAGEPSAADLAEFNDKMAEISLPVLRDKEKMLARVYERAQRENAYLMVVSDHGFTLTSKGYNHYGLPAGTTPPDGILMLAGPGVRGGRQVPATVYDVAPTILHLMGLPVGRDMDGRPLLAALAAPKPVRYTVYTRMKHQPGNKDDERDRKRIEELKALGYIN